MTREEQIQQQADKYIGHSEDLGEDINTTIDRIAFIEGAKWADENLQKELVSIDKVCEYLYLTLHNSYDEDGAHIVASKDSCFLVEFIEDFKKYIEGLK